MASWLWTALVFSALLLAGCGGTPSGLDTYGSVPDFSLTDQTGNAFESSAKLKDAIWVADFMFTNCPGPCPRMSAQMKEIQTALTGTGIKLVSFTVDPKRDTPEILSLYASNYSARPGIWFFLTGPQATLNSLSKNVFQLGEVDGSLEHSTRFVLVDRKARIRGYYLTSEQNAIKRVIADARSLLKERT